MKASNNIEWFIWILVINTYCDIEGTELGIITNANLLM